MNPSSSIKRKSGVLTQSYQAALRQYIQEGSAAGLKSAMRLGRKAVELGLETLDLARIHEQAMIDQALPIDSATIRGRIIKRAGVFFIEAILPMEKTHRSALEGNVHLSRLNQALKQRTLGLADSNWKLKREIARRRVVEENLRQSEQHSSGLLAQSRRMQEQLQLLSRRVLSAQEEERKRISRELHDVIAQVLTGINVRLTVLKTEATLNTKGLTKNIARTQRLVEKSVDIVHRFARELRPAVLDHLGLIPALHSFMKSFMKETGIRVSLTAFAGLEELSSAKRTAIYRIAQEALTNVSRHAQASRVGVRIEKRRNVIYIQIKDNGKSFDVERIWHARRSQRLGLLGMRERAAMVGGSFAVESTQGNGTTIKIQIPFHNGNGESARP